jgi:hypothetical protein
MFAGNAPMSANLRSSGTACASWRYTHLPDSMHAIGSGPVKKGRHRRFEEARALKRTSEPSFDEILDKADELPCPECGAEPGRDHASWCLYEDQVAAEAEDPWP